MRADPLCPGPQVAKEGYTVSTLCLIACGNQGHHQGKPGLMHWQQPIPQGAWCNQFLSTCASLGMHPSNTVKGDVALVGRPSVPTMHMRLGVVTPLDAVVGVERKPRMDARWGGPTPECHCRVPMAPWGYAAMRMLDPTGPVLLQGPDLALVHVDGNSHAGTLSDNEV